jgi:cytoskeletal protein RodZ
MSQGVRDLLANRRFAVPLIVLLAFCLIGLILIGIVLIWQPGPPDDGGSVAQNTATPLPESTETLAPTAAETATPRSSPTLVPVGTQVVSTKPASTVVADPSTAEAEETEAAPQQTLTAEAGETATAEAGSGEDATPAPTESPEEGGELAQTGIGWGLVLFSGAGLGLLAAVARRLRLNPQ